MPLPEEELAEASVGASPWSGDVCQHVVYALKLWKIATMSGAETKNLLRQLQLGKTGRLPDARNLCKFEL